jgi:hypothetical protein
VIGGRLPGTGYWARIFACAPAMVARGETEVPAALSFPSGATKKNTVAFAAVLRVAFVSACPAPEVAEGGGGFEVGKVGGGSVRKSRPPPV